MTTSATVKALEERLRASEEELRALRVELDEIYQIMAVIGFNSFMHNRYFKQMLESDK